MGLFSSQRNKHIPHLDVLPYTADILMLPRKLLVLTESGTGEDSSTVPDCWVECSATWVISPSKLNVIWDVMGRYGLIWNLWQVPIGEWQRRLLWFWNKTLLPSTDNGSPFEKYLLAWYWTLVYTKYLAMSNQLTMWTKLSIMCWIFSHPPSYKAGHVQQ